MAKILLVEDDNNLREIYEARLQAEGYDIVSAKDGEEALVVAKKERPDLIIADVMMPRVSGFEMLDIIRNTPELKDVHVIMLTALGQAEDKTRADSLGADRYLVKSQVTLEDIVKSAADVLAGAPAGTPAITAAAADGTQTPTAMPVPVAVAPTAAPVAVAPAPEPAVPTQDTATPAAPPQPSVAIPVSAPPVDASAPQAPTAPVAVAPPAASAIASVPAPSTTDSQLVTDAVNNLVSGTAGAQDATAAPTPTPVADPNPVAPPPPVAEPATTLPPPPAAPLTMQPVLTPPIAPAPSAAVPPPAAPVATPLPPVTDNPAIPPSPATSRKAITPLPAGSTPGQPDLNELLAKEGHSMDDSTNAPGIGGAPSHMPGNVITPGGSAPASQNPTDPNSISL